MATTEPAVTSVVIVLTTLCVTRPADTARRPVKYHPASSVQVTKEPKKLNCCFYIFYGVFFAVSFDWSVFVASKISAGN